MKRFRRINRSASRIPRLACALVVVGTALAVNIAAQPALEVPFIRITSGAIATEMAMSGGAAWGDYDNDGWLDLFVANAGPGERNSLFRNNRDGTFAKILSGPFATDPSATSYAGMWVDYDNDGWLDLFVVNHASASPNALYRNTGGDSFVRIPAAEVGAVATDATHSLGAAWGDYDRDGFLDLFVANGTYTMKLQDFLYHQNGAEGRFIRVTNNIALPILTSSQGTWIDYDNDGDLDLFVAQFKYLGNSLFRNDGAGQFVNVAAASGLGDLADSVGASWGDYDNDGDLDLFVTNMEINGSAVRNLFYRNNGDRTFTRITTGIVAEDQDHFLSCSWVDYDNDGWLDLFVTVFNPVNTAPNGIKNRLYHNQGDGSFVRINQGGLVTDGTNAGGCAWGDYNNDGFLDVFVPFGTNFSPQRNGLYRNLGNHNSWIKIRCVGTVSNRSAIGTKIYVKAKIGGVERWQMRQSVSSEGWLTSNSQEAVIGLGDATVIDTLRVEWPSGFVQELHNLPAKQTLTLVERTALSIAAGIQGDSIVTVRGPRQQRYRMEASTDLTTWLSVSSLTVTNTAGTASFTHTPTEGEARMFFRATPE